MCKITKYIFVVVFGLFLSSLSVTAQTETATNTSEEVKVKRERGPLVASLLSTAVPGLGQVYNGKHWKVPIIYGGLATVIYYHGIYDQLYKEYLAKTAHFDQKGPFVFYNITETNVDVVEQRKDSYRRSRDLMVIIGTLAYVLNIADATVDAHLKDYDISRDLSLNLSPIVTPVDDSFTFALQCSIRF